MKPEEAINVLLENVPKCCKMIDGRYQGGFNDWDCDMGQAIRLAVLALQDIRNYRNIVNKTDRNELAKIIDEWLEYSKIGTVEECREAVEKQKPKKPKEILRHRGGFETLHCPNCNTDYQMDNRYTITEGYCPACGKLIDSVFRNYCGNCGQAIDENLEGME